MTRVGSPSVGIVVVEMRMTSLVAKGSRVTSMGATLISDYECHRNKVRRFKGALELEEM